MVMLRDGVGLSLPRASEQKLKGTWIVSLSMSRQLSLSVLLSRSKKMLDSEPIHITLGWGLLRASEQKPEDAG